MGKKIFLDYQSSTPVSDRVLKKMLPFFSEKFAKYKNSFIFATAITIAYFNTGWFRSSVGRAFDF